METVALRASSGNACSEGCDPKHEDALRDACCAGNAKRFHELVETTWRVGRWTYCVALDVAPEVSRSVPLGDKTVTCTGRTFLHHAAYGGNVEIMKYLLSCKVPAHAKDSMGRTPFYLACARGHLECVKLLGQGSINIRDNYGDTPLLAACTGTQALDVVTCLLERDADIEACGVAFVENGEGDQCKTSLVRMNALSYAVCTGSIALAKLLLEWGARRQALDVKVGEIGQTPLEIAEDSNHTETLEFIRNTGGTKRPRRQTPVKDRAVKVGLELPPTPAGVREVIEHGSPSKKCEAKTKLQRHQKRCQQKVDRAEARAADVHSARAKRFRMGRSKQAMESYWRRKDAKDTAKS